MVGFRSPAFWLGISSPAAQAGYRSLLAFWVGGACSSIAPIVTRPKGDGGGYLWMQWEIEMRNKKRLEQEIEADDEDVAKLLLAWIYENL